MEPNPRATGRVDRVTVVTAGLTILLMATAVGVLRHHGAVSCGPTVRLTGALRQPTAFGMAFSPNQVVAGWRVTALRFHSEFVRVTFRRHQAVSTIEINRCMKPDTWCGGAFRVQPAPPRPGQQAPPRALLVKARDRLAAHGGAWPDYMKRDAIPLGKIQPFLRWTLLAPLILLLGGLGAIRLLRSDGRLDRLLLGVADACDRATAHARSAIRPLLGPVLRITNGLQSGLQRLQQRGSTRRGLVLLLLPMAWLAATTFRPMFQVNPTGGDPRVYYTAVASHQQGGDPYNGEQLQRRSGVKDLGNYTYPPYMLRAFAWMGALSYDTVCVIFAVVKGAALLLLFGLWLRMLRCRGADVVLLLLIAIPGFQYCIRMDITSGNLSILEQTALWGGLLAYTAGRRGLFAVLVVLASAAKLHWIGLLVLPVIMGDRRGTAIAALGLAGFAAALALSLGLQPLLGNGFVTTFGNSTLIEHGDMNPGSLPVATDLVASLWGQSFGASVKLGWKLYAIFAVACCLLALPALAAARRTASRTRLLMLTVVLYALLLPQLKDYSYIVLIPPTYYAIRHLGLGLATRALLLLGACTHFFVYQSWGMLVVLFATYLLAPVPTAALAPPDATDLEVIENGQP